ncbi:MAG: alanine--tRNA ligase [Candidatus Bathyarchaeota archaeon]|nr:MAG: alanine--tRNA ligase [Candidatus Bathyarchaeota archaeon]
MARFPASEYHVPFFDEHRYIRKRCPICDEYFWTQNPDQETCGEAAAEGCASLTFINNPPTRKRYTLQEMREAFLSFFERRGHERIKPYPVVARWRDDLYLTSASIVDFQPYVTNGITPPPANPLVISQPCIRLVDVDNVGPTFGRHLTIFEMGGHHAFNYPDNEVYWKDQTVRYHHEFVTEELRVKSEDVIYKEDVWSGGGNAGPDLETVICGLEVATLVFMKFKVVNGEFVELPIRTVDTGYGNSRYTWLSQGSISCFHSLYGPILDKIMRMAGIGRVDHTLLARAAELSGLMSLEKAVDRRTARENVAKQIGITAEELNKTLLPVENIFAVLDHTKCLVFMLAEGVVPSNVGEGYLTRLMLRRTLRLLRTLEIQEKLLELIGMQIEFWTQDFPYLKKMREEIFGMLAVEQDKFDQTIRRGRSIVKRMGQELKAKGAHVVPTESLLQLYDSHGLPPEIVKETAEKGGLQVEIPENFYSMVADRHEQPPPSKKADRTEALKSKVSNLPETRLLYYEDPYQTEFEAKVLRVSDVKNVVLSETAFYPEGGGQPADKGYLEFAEEQSEVVDVQKIGKVIIHAVKGQIPKKGDRVKGTIDWKWRSSLMKHHTATHLIMGATRRVLGEHVWQSGSQKGIDKTRLDVSHFQRLTPDEIHEIERLANNAVIRNIPVEASWMARGEAERLYGFRLYQGGAVPGKEIRVVKTGDWEVEACGGTHLKNTGEIGFIKIINTERIQDGVERIIFSAGLPAVNAMQERERMLWKVSEVLNAPLEKLEKTAERLVREWKEIRREKERLVGEIADLAAKEFMAAAKRIGTLKVITRKVAEADVDRLIKTAGELIRKETNVVVVLCGVDKTAKLVVMAGEQAVKQGVDSAEIARNAASVLGGGGSGRPDFAQGGGTLVEKASDALEKAEEAVREQLGED